MPATSGWRWSPTAMAGTGWGRWLGLVTAVWVQCVSGNNYTFSNYSAALKSLMSLTQLELNNLSVAKDVGKAFGLLAGLASDHVPTPLILLIGSLEGLLGYGAQWLVVSKTVKPFPYWQMCIYMCLGGNSTTWMNTAVLVTCIRNFRKNRGPVSGILKGYIGLSTAIFTDLCTTLYADNPASFLMMLAVVPFAVCIIAMVFLQEDKSGAAMRAGSADEGKYFWVMNLLAIVIAVYLLVFDLAGIGSNTVMAKVFVAVLVVLLVSPVSLPVYVGVKEWLSKRREADAEGALQEAERPLLVANQEQEKPVDPIAARGGRRPELGEDHTIPELLVSPDFWVLFVSFLMGVGTGLAVMNNLGQMGQAMGYNDVAIFVSMTSIWGFFGRIGSGTVSEHFIKTKAIPRPLWNAAAQVVMAGGYILMAIAIPNSILIGSICVGLCYGVRIAISVPAASELFGLRYYGLIYNILILNLPLGSFLFSGLLAGFLYDAEATKLPDGSNTCSGAHCYRLVFFVMAAACVVGFGLDMLLAYRTRDLYRRIQASKQPAGSRS